ncbi:tetratricopeptide repeat protein [Flindersiella endophytica]
MVADIFIGWAIGKLLDRGTDALKASDSEYILTAATIEIRSEFPPGWRGDRLTEAIKDQLQGQLDHGGELRIAFEAQLLPLRDFVFDRPDRSRETAGELLDQLGLDFDVLVALVVAGFERAVRTVAVERASLPEKLLLAEVTQRAEAGSSAVQNTLERPPRTMVGRDHELRQLLAIADVASTLLVTAVHGMGGVGKTALARRFAASVRKRFRDATYEIDLHGFTPGQEPRRPDDALADLLRLAGFPATSIPSSLTGKSERWRGWLASHSVLLVIDNARSAGQVAPLLPGEAPGCLVLVTSRESLPELEVDHRLRLDLLSEADSVALLQKLSGRTDEVELAEIARICGWLPLALRAIGPLLNSMTPSDLVQVMRSAANPLEHLDEVERAVHAALTVSYEALGNTSRQRLRWLAIHPGPDFDAASAAALWDVPPAFAMVELTRLTTANLLLRTAGERFEFHDLLLAYLRDLAARHDAAVRAGVMERLFRSLNERLWAAREERGILGGDAPAFRSAHIFGGSKAAVAWLEAAASELEAVAKAAIESAWSDAFTFAKESAYWLWLNGRLPAAQAVLATIERVSERRQDKLAHAYALWGQAEVLRVLGRFSAAIDLFRRSYDLAVEIDDPQSIARALRGQAEVDRCRERHEAAAEMFAESAALFASAGDRFGEANALRGSAEIARASGRLQQATELYDRSERLYGEIGERLGEADILRGRAGIAQCTGDYAASAERYRKAQDLYEEVGDSRGKANTFEGLAEFHRSLGGLAEAAEEYRSAIVLYEEAGDLFGQAHAWFGWAQLAEEMGASGAAREAYRNALSQYAAMELTERAGRCAEALSRLDSG